VKYNTRNSSFNGNVFSVARFTDIGKRSRDFDQLNYYPWLAAPR